MIRNLLKSVLWTFRVLKKERFRVQMNKLTLLESPCGVMQNALGKIELKRIGNFISNRRIYRGICGMKNWIWVNPSPLSATNAATARRH